MKKSTHVAEISTVLSFWHELQSSPGLAMRRASVFLRVLPPLLAISAYLNALHNPFVYDDATEILENISIRDLSDLRFVILGHSITRPITNVSYALDYAFWGLNAFGYHLTNVLLHALNVVLLFTIARHIDGDFRRGRGASGASTFTAFIASSLFAVHPMMTEAVGYVTGRAELLMAALVLSSFYFFRRELLGGGPGPLVAGIVSFVLALGAKETAVMLPFVMFAYDALILRRDQNRKDARRRLWRIHVPLITVVLLAAGARVWLYTTIEQRTTAGFRWQSMMADIEVLSHYISLLCIPISQSFVHGSDLVRSVFDLSLLTAVGVLMLVVGLAVIARLRVPLVALGIVWCFAFLIPGMSLVLLADIGQPMAERRAYLAGCGFFMAIAAGATHLFDAEGRRDSVSWIRGGTVLGVALASLLTLTVMRNRIWSDPVLLWTDAASKAPRTWLAQFGLGDAYQSVGDCESAIPRYRSAVALIPENPQAYDGLAACLVELQRPDEARTALRAAIQRVPSATLELLTLAALEEQAHNPAEALRLCREASKLAAANQTALRCIQRNERRLSTP